MSLDLILALLGSLAGLLALIFGATPLGRLLAALASFLSWRKKQVEEAEAGVPLAAVFPLILPFLQPALQKVLVLLHEGLKKELGREPTMHELNALLDSGRVKVEIDKL